MTDGPDDPERVIDAVARDVLGIGGDEGALAASDRQILLVRQVTFFSAGYRPGDTDPAPRDQQYLLLRGDPSPSSQVTSGYIRFVTPGELRVPAYSAAHRRIDLWLRPERVRMVIEQMKHKDRYLWIGFFPGGHVYADIHSSP